ncbi:MAG: hypothetical protein GY940_31455, partial [bacterium]|nr:hypothetical protein [bacterium]
PILFHQLSTLYQTYSRSNPGNPLSRLRTQYKDYSRWQNTYILKGLPVKQKEYWHKTLSGEPPVLDLPADYPRPAVKTYHGNTLHYVLDKELAPGLNHLCKEQGATLFMILLAAVKLLIYRYTGHKDIIIGSPIAGRNHTDLENQVGFYVNTLALRSRQKPGETVKAFLDQVKNTVLDALENQIYPFDQLVDELDLDRDTSRHPLFDIMVVMQNNEPVKLKFANLRVTPCDIPSHTAKFDLTFMFTEAGETIRLDIEYNTGLFKQDRVQRLYLHFKELVKNMTTNPGQATKDIDILTQKEKKQLLLEFNDTAVDYPKDKTIPQLFAEQAGKRPDGVAVVGRAQGGPGGAPIKEHTTKDEWNRSTAGGNGGLLPSREGTLSTTKEE